MSNRLAFQTQLASIMEVLANAAVAEICKLVDDDYAVVSLQMSQCQRENKALKRKLNLLELKMARGYAERRLRESALNSRPKVHINTNSDRFRGISPGVFDKSVDVSLWSKASSVHQANNPIRNERIQEESSDVQLVERQPLMVKEEIMEEGLLEHMEDDDVPLIGEDGVVECGPRRRTSSQQDVQAAMSHASGLQSPSQPRSQSQGLQTRQRSGGGRGVESACVGKEEEPDVVLVKVEEPEPSQQTQEVLSIQEGLVESSTDDHRGGLPLDEIQTSTDQLAQPHGLGQVISEVSFGHSSIWTNENDHCHANSVPGPSSFSPLMLSYPPGAFVRGSERGLAPKNSGSFHSAFSLPVQGASQMQSVEGVVYDGMESFVQVQGRADQQGQQLPGQRSGQVMDAGSANKTTRTKAYICKFCGKAFSAPANLEAHLRTHTGERPFGCNVCGKHFSQFWNLKIHRNVHTGERPYPCPRCPERFADPSNLKKHQKRHHPQPQL